jgi:hypothetical protein
VDRSAFRESPHPNEMAFSTASITSITWNTGYRPAFTLDAAIDRFEPGSREEKPNGTCWHYLVRNPVIVRGFPIPRRENEERGIEMPLGLMAGLGNASRATVFDQGLVIKGHSTMFVPVKREKNSVVWHFLFHQDETRIPYLEASKLCHSRLSSEELDSSRLEISRNFVGWSSSVHLQAGKLSQLRFCEELY